MHLKQSEAKLDSVRPFSRTSNTSYPWKSYLCVLKSLHVLRLIPTLYYYTTLHYTTLHYTTLRCTTLTPYPTLHYTTTLTFIINIIIIITTIIIIIIIIIIIKKFSFFLEFCNPDAGFQQVTWGNRKVF